MRNKDTIAWRRVGDDSVVLLDLETGRYNSLNRSAAIVWAAVVCGQTVPACAQILVQHYPSLASDQANEAVTGLIDRLQERGLLTEGEPDAAVNAADLEFKSGGDFQAPACEEHEALQEVTAGTYGNYSGSYYYYYYY